MIDLAARRAKNSIVSHRTRSAQATCEWAAAVARACGITRCGAVTGLDRIGIPVYLSYRPNARSISVSAGKGMDDASARASALMEAIELHHAEIVSRDRVFCLADAAKTGLRVIDPGLFAVPRYVEMVRTLPLAWLPGIDLFAELEYDREPPSPETTISVPHDAVHGDFRMETLSRTTAGLFCTTSNGLASGSTMAEAVCHGLCEVIERHSLIVWASLTAEQRAATRVALDSIHDDNVCALLERLDRSDVAIAIWDMTAELGVPVFRCAICDRTPDGFYALMPSVGSGCHPDRSYALIRAITEAVQARLTLISGAREDISHGMYRAGFEPALWESLCAEIVGITGSRDVAHVPRAMHEYVEDDITWLLQRLRSAGVELAVAVDLSRPEFGVPVVRVLVPELRAPIPHAGGVHIEHEGH